MCALKRDSSEISNSTIVTGARRIGSAIGELLYPPICAICEKRYGSEAFSICPHCWSLALQNRRQKPSANNYFAENTSEDIEIVPAISLGAYQSPLSDILQKFKYEGFISLGERISLAFARLRKSQILALKPEALLPIPLHISAFKARGFNQARIISDIIMKVTGLPVADNVVEKVVKTKNQAKLSASQRQHNLAGAFIAIESEWRGKRVILVDDVITTGATIAEVWKTAEQAGVEIVGAIAISSAIETCSMSPPKDN